ncbi:transcription initiation factor TFIID subunit 4B isoform X2 [Pipistrellus kuhlii]|uniref:transcription initiation factor TFIID subunit 4B isoform X2 n=1 Tax=Pipistrellus kuhlii TaxID=59472 RepID=UPI001E2730DC|nr:transcription initiation factor TFIID subunit 4B isoform X2 [Pipistrellus kuhlii]
MPAGLPQPAGPAPLAAGGSLAGARPGRAEGASAAPGAVAKAAVQVRVEPAAAQPPRPPAGTLAAPVAPVSALPAAQIVAVKAPAAAIQLPAHLQLPPGTVLIKSNSGQLMLVSPQQPVTRAETTSTIISRPALPANPQTVKICAMPNSNSQLIKKVAVAPAKQLAQMGATVVTTVTKPSLVQTVAVPSSVVTVTPVKSSNTVTTLKSSSLGAAHALSSEPIPNAGSSAAAQTSLTPDAKIEAEEFTRQLYVELKSSPQPHLVPFLKKSVSALRQLLPSSQSFIQQCVQQPSGEACAAACTAPATAVVTATDSSVPAEKALGVSGAATPRTVSVQSLNSLVGPAGAKAGVVTVHSVGPAAAPPVVLPTPKPLVATAQNAVTAVSLPPEKPVVCGAGVTLALPPVTVGEPSPALCLPSVSVKTVVTSAGTSSEKPVVSAPVQITLAPPGPILPQSAALPQAVKVKQLVVQQPAGGLTQQVGAPLPSSALTLQKKMPVTTAVASASILKQTTLPGNKILSLQVSSIQKDKRKENGATSLRDEDDINDVTFMAGVNLNEENACILATNSDLVGTLIQSCKDEPFLFVGALQKRILDIGKKHDVTELSSEAVNLISHATQERLRGLLEKLTTIARHRMMAYKTSDSYILSSDTRSQLKFLEKLDQLEKQRKDLEEREMLLKAAKSRSNKEDPEQLRLKQKAKELQQMELAQIQQRDANLTALAAIGPRRKRPLEAAPGSEGLKDKPLAPGTCGLAGSRQLPRPRATRVCLRDLVFCMEQERDMKHSRALYLALLK